ncbi:MaoC family dehydratase [Piscinibacter sp.]|uniref:MaoC family dehydratase n=1 Tax=Piscinibacter sp. TaxID=1903157 RepID=UPI002C284792|nr:MaoC family dehydratase [Albitalea sp.]HUG24732.1 MaoC family dehydratase [Albitalea sp.]
MDARATEHLIAAGETVSKTVRVSREEIIAFARMSHDANPLHTDIQVAQRARFGEIIASGQHTAAILMGMLATHFSRSDDGVRREMLCLNMNFAFKGPVFAEQDVTLQWKVATVQWNGKLQGLLAHLDGAASVSHGRPAVVARGTILVKESPP